MPEREGGKEGERKLSANGGKGRERGRGGGGAGSSSSSVNEASLAV